MMCAPEERPDATPSGHRVGVEDAESVREDCSSVSVFACISEMFGERFTLLMDSVLQRVSAHEGVRARLTVLSANPKKHT